MVTKFIVVVILRCIDMSIHTVVYQGLIKYYRSVISQKLTNKRKYSLKKRSDLLLEVDWPGTRDKLRCKFSSTSGSDVVNINTGHQGRPQEKWGKASVFLFGSLLGLGGGRIPRSQGFSRSHKPYSLT